MSEQRTQQNSPLQTERGITRIEDSVVAKVAGIAAQEVDGVRMGGGSTQAIGGLLSSVTGGSSGGSNGGGSPTRGISVEVGEIEAAVDATLTVAYGRSIPQVAEAVRRNIINRIESLLGLRVTEVNIQVNDVFFPEAERQQQQQREQQQQQQQQQSEEQQRVR